MSILDRKASGEELMVIGFGMCAAGMLFKEYYFTIGGFALFLGGVLTLRPIEVEKEEGGRQEEGERTENPLGRPPS